MRAVTTRAGKRWTVAAALSILIGATGCIRLHGPTDLRDAIGRSAGVELEQESGLTITRSGMVLARWGMKAAGEDIKLEGVRRLEVGVYRVRGGASASPGPIALDWDAGADWQTVVRAHGADEDVVLRVLPDERGRIRRLVLVVADSDEWVLVRMRGKLDAVFEDALELAFDRAGRPELYAELPREPDFDASRLRAEGPDPL